MDKHEVLTPPSSSPPGDEKAKYAAEMEQAHTTAELEEERKRAMHVRQEAHLCRGRCSK